MQSVLILIFCLLCRSATIKSEKVGAVQEGKWKKISAPPDLLPFMGRLVVLKSGEERVEKYAQIDAYATEFSAGPGLASRYLFPKEWVHWSRGILYGELGEVDLYMRLISTREAEWIKGKLMDGSYAFAYQLGSGIPPYCELHPEYQTPKQSKWELTSDSITEIRPFHLYPIVSKQSGCVNCRVLPSAHFAFE